MPDHHALLIAGPLALDDLGGETGLVGGAGAYAALAAAPLCPTQLWARGEGWPAGARSVLERRRVDCAGVAWDDGGRGALPTVEPVSAEGLGAVLLIDLAPDELRRALAVVRALPGSETRPLLIAPRERGAPALADAAAAADVVIVRGVDDDPLAQAMALRQGGAKCVAVTRGMGGGLVVYGDKAVTWPALPVPVVEPTGAGAAFAGALAAWCAAVRKADFSTVKRGLALASAVGGAVVQGPGPRKLLTLGSKEYHERFNKLRRAGKY